MVHGFLSRALSCFCFTSCTGHLRSVASEDLQTTLLSYPFEDWGPSTPSPGSPPLVQTVVTCVPGGDGEGEEHAAGHSLSQRLLGQLTPGVGSFVKLLEGLGGLPPWKNLGPVLLLWLQSDNKPGEASQKSLI